MEAHERVRIHGGDGDQRFFVEHETLRPTTASWFPRKLGEWYGDALLFVTEGGICDGDYVALTPRGVGQLQEMLDVNGYASVIVHKITNPTASFDPAKDELAVGMAYVVVTPERISSPWMRGEW